MWNRKLLFFMLGVVVVDILKVSATEDGRRHIRSVGGKKPVGDKKIEALSNRSPKQDDSSEQEDDEQGDTKASTGGNKTEKVDPVTIGSFRAYVHAIDSSDVIILDEKTLEIPDFSYDGEGPASYFVVGNDGEYTREFVDLPDITVIPDENESCNGLKRYNQETIKLTLPGKLKVSDISYLSVYCLRFNHNFAYVAIPDDIKPPKAGPKTAKLDECEGIESAEANAGNNQRPQPPPQSAAPAPSGGRPGLLGGLLNLLGRK